MLNLADGSQAKLLDNSEQDTAASWSPDGTQVVYLADVDGAMVIMVIDADGANPTLVLGGATTTP